MLGGWPTTAAISSAITDYTGFSLAGGVFTLTTNCTVTYNNAGAGVFPAVTVASNGC
jgi:hypothetical protein